MADDKTAEAAKPKGKKTLVLAAVAGALLLLAGAGGAFWLGAFGGAGEAEAAADAEPAAEGAHDDAAGEHGAAAAPAHQPVFVDLPPLLVNLVVGEGRSRFLKLSLAVEVDDQRVADRITQLAPRIVDSFQLYLRTLTPAELQGPGSMFRLKEDLHLRIHEAIEPVRVRDVLFKEMLVQ